MTYNDMLTVMYEQYFCYVCEYTSEQLLEAHKAFGDALNKNEDMEYEDLEQLDFLAIWQPFEDVKPEHVYDNIVEGVKRLQGLLNND